MLERGGEAGLGDYNLHVLEGSLVEVSGCDEVDSAIRRCHAVGAACQLWRVRDVDILGRIVRSPNNGIWVLLLDRVLVQWLRDVIERELANQRGSFQRRNGGCVGGHYTNDRVVVWDLSWGLVNTKLLDNLVIQELAVAVAVAAHDCFTVVRYLSFSRWDTYFLVVEFRFNFFVIIVVLFLLW